MDEAPILEPGGAEVQEEAGLEVAGLQVVDHLCCFHAAELTHCLHFHNDALESDEVGSIGSSQWIFTV